MLPRSGFEIGVPIVAAIVTVAEIEASRQPASRLPARERRARPLRRGRRQTRLSRSPRVRAGRRSAPGGRRTVTPAPRRPRRGPSAGGRRPDRASPGVRSSTSPRPAAWPTSDVFTWGAQRGSLPTARTPCECENSRTATVSPRTPSTASTEVLGRRALLLGKVRCGSTGSVGSASSARVMVQARVSPSTACQARAARAALHSGQPDGDPVLAHRDRVGPPGGARGQPGQCQGRVREGPGIGQQRVGDRRRLAAGRAGDRAGPRRGRA